jgi:hypothetical protein
MIKAYAAMFLEEPHRTTRNYAALRARVGTGIFAQGHRMDPYYTAAFALYKLEFLFRTGRLEAKYRPAKFHILLAARCIAAPSRPPWPNSRDMERYCKTILDKLWDSTKADEILASAALVIDIVAAGNFHRDNIRTEPFTNKVLTTFDPKQAPGAVN